MDDPSPAAHFPAVQPHPSVLTDCTHHEHGLSFAWRNSHPVPQHLLLQTTAARRALSPLAHTQDLVHSPDISQTSTATTQTSEFIRDVTTRLLAAHGACEPVGGYGSCQDTASPISSLLPGQGCCPPGHCIAHLLPSPTSSHRPALTHSGSVRPRGTRFGGDARAMPAALGSRRAPGKQNEAAELLHHLPLPPWAPASSGGCCGTAPRWVVLGKGVGRVFAYLRDGSKK